jgi:glutathione S-transferase
MGTYTLFWSPGSASVAPHGVLEELGVAYGLSRVDIDRPRDPAYLKLNPHGLVPTLIADGQAIYESAAIVMHLLDRHPDKGLAPAIGTPQRGLYYQWLLYLANTLQPAFRRYYHTQSLSPDPAHLPVLKNKALEDVREVWKHLDGELSRKPYLAGDQFTGADIYLHMLVSWDPDMDTVKQNCPNLAAAFTRVQGRPAIARVAAMNL